MKMGQFEIEPDHAAGYTQLDPHSATWRRFTLRGEIQDVGTVTLEVEVDEDGGAACKRFELSAERVTTELVRRVPVGKVLAAGMAVSHFRWGEDPGGLRIDFGDKTARRATADEKSEVYTAYAKSSRKPRSGSPVTDEHLRDVADRYRRAVRQGRPPTKAVADEMHASRSTAARWVGIARKRELLGPAPAPGKWGGEVKDES